MWAVREGPSVSVVDAPKHKVAAFYKHQRRVRQAEQKRRHRETGKKARDPRMDGWSPRARAVFAFLHGRGWVSTADIATGLAGDAAFDGLSTDALRRALRRAVVEMAAAVDQKVLEARTRGLRHRSLWVRRR
jgi:hypothetical protein